MNQPMQTGQSSPAPAPKKQRNTIAIVALVTSIIGFIFAVMEGAYIVGWILLPIAFVLSLVGLAQRGKPKGLAIAALIVSIVGTIAGVLAFMSSTVTAIDEAFNDEVTEVVDSSVAADVQAVEDEVPAETDDSTDEASSESGTRSNPYPVGATVKSDEWEVTVNSIEMGATDAVLAENPFNEEPAEGMAYGLANVTAKYLGEEASTTMMLSFDYVTEEGNTMEMAAVVAPEKLSSEELYAGASETGNVVFQHPTDDAGVLKVSLGMFADDVFFAVS